MANVVVTTGNWVEIALVPTVIVQPAATENKETNGGLFIPRDASVPLGTQQMWPRGAGRQP